MSTTLEKLRTGKTSGAMAKAGSGVVEVYVHGRIGKSTVRGFAPAKMIKFVQGGLPIEELNALQATLAVPMDTLATKLGISKATLHRRKLEGKLWPDESDRVVRYARLMGRAVKIFGGLGRARAWMNSPQFGLGGAAPLDYAETEIGAREVENLLGRMEYGVYS